MISEAEDNGIEFGSSEFWVWLNSANNSEAFEEMRAEISGPGGRGKPGLNRLPVWHQLRFVGYPAPLASPTRFGTDVFDDDAEGEYKCPDGHVAGINVLSEIYVRRDDLPTSDLAVSRERAGDFRGLLRPAPILLAMPRVRDVLLKRAFKGARFEIAHVIDEGSRLAD